MREIKLRAWNIPTKNMFNWGTLQRINRTDSRNIEAEHNHFMQYTGLNDKNGKEIYEGDIVECLEENYVISYSDKFMCFEAWYNGLIGSKDITPVHVKGSEVIGSIYENKDLLNN